MTEAIKNAGVPGRLSNTAGTFVCNHVLYQLGYLADKSYPGLRFGFIHVPFIPEQTINKPDKPSMSIHTIVKGLTAQSKQLIPLKIKSRIRRNTLIIFSTTKQEVGTEAFRICAEPNDEHNCFSNFVEL